MKSKGFKILKIGGIVLGAFVVLLIVTLLFVGFVWEDKIKQAVISSVNQQFDEEIAVGSIDFSVLSKFPYASVVLNDVSIESSRTIIKNQFGTNTDTLLKATSLFLEFNLIKVAQGEFLLRRLEVSDGKLRLFTDKGDHTNFQFWETSDTLASEFSVDLSRVTLHNMELLYDNRKQDLLLHTHVHDLHLSGNLNQSNYALKAAAVVWVGTMEVNGEPIIARRPVQFNIDFQVDEQLFTIKEGVLATAGMEFITQGSYQAVDNLIDFQVKGNDLNIQSFISVLPKEMQKQAEDIGSSGLFYLNGSVKGSIADGKNPEVKVVFGVTEGKVNDSNTGLKLKAIKCDGVFTNGPKRTSTSSMLQLENLSFNVGAGSSFKGSLELNNLKKPRLTIVSTFKALPADFSGFLKEAGLSNYGGVISGDVRVSGVNKDYQYSGSVDINDLYLEFKDGLLIDKVSAVLQLDGKTLATENAVFSLLQNNFQYSGKLLNLEDYLFNDGRLNVVGDLTMEELNLNEFVKESNESSEVSSSIFPEKVNASINFSSDKIIYEQLALKNNKIKLKLRNKQLSADWIGTRTLNGSISGTVLFSEHKDYSLSLKGSQQLDDIDIHELFYAFKNFGQDFLTADHLMGDVTGTIAFECDFDKNHDLISKNLYVESSFAIVNGELYDFEPLHELSTFIDVSEIDHLKFSKLENDIVVQNEKVYFPQMQINSNLLNLKVAGIHGFDESYSYKLELLLSEILSKKAREQNRSNADYDPFDESANKSMLFLKMEGDANDSHISYDRDALRDRRKQNMKKEKQNLKMILNEEWGMFKKDSSTFKKTKAAEESTKKKKVRIVWDEDEPDEDDDSE